MIRRVLMAAGVLAGYAGVALFQPAEAPVFDAASVKPASPTPYMALAMSRNGGPGTTDPGTLTYTNAPLRALLEDAYGVQSRQVIGPGWLETARFDISAAIGRDLVFRLTARKQTVSDLAELLNLGLRLDSRKAPFDFLVIDRISKTPTEN